LGCRGERKRGRRKRKRLTVTQAGKDDFLDQSVTPFAHPSVLMENKLLLQSYTRNSHAIVTLLLELLNTHLQLPPNTLPSLHALPTISGDQIRFIKSPPQPPSDLRTAMGAHTDFGSLTILFNRLGGLQVLLPGQTAWSYVRPLPGHAIINLGDAMVKFSGGVLRSNIHRVVSPPREQGSETRYAIVYFARPGDGVAMKRLEGGIVPGLKEGETEEEDVSAAEWIVDKAMARRAGVYEGERIGKARVTNEEELRQEVLAS
jgi:isopenicillin N synthase-like dioxygenase